MHLAREDVQFKVGWGIEAVHESSTARLSRLVDRHTVCLPYTDSGPVLRHRVDNLEMREALRSTPVTQEICFRGFFPEPAWTIQDRLLSIEYRFIGGLPYLSPIALGLASCHVSKCPSGFSSQANITTHSHLAQSDLSTSLRASRD